MENAVCDCVCLGGCGCECRRRGWTDRNRPECVQMVVHSKYFVPKWVGMGAQAWAGLVVDRRCRRGGKRGLSVFCTGSIRA